MSTEPALTPALLAFLEKEKANNIERMRQCQIFLTDPELGELLNNSLIINMVSFGMVYSLVVRAPGLEYGGRELESEACT